MLVDTNYSEFGAGLYLAHSEVTLTGSKLTGNRGWHTGAGLYGINSHLVMEDCQVSDGEISYWARQRRGAPEWCSGWGAGAWG